MHIEFLIEDSSGERLLQHLIPKMLGSFGDPHTWKMHAYKGIGRIPPGLTQNTDPAKRMLLNQLPRLLRGYALTPGIDAVVIILDADQRNCEQFMLELKQMAGACYPAPNALFQLAIEEIEAWYLGDVAALKKAYPRAKMDVLAKYVQDSICGTWELLADAIYPGGATGLKKAGWPLPGQVKHEWAEKIGPFMVLENNVSPSFGSLHRSLRQLVSATA